MAIDKEKLTNYEKTRILGARALQVAMDAPLLAKIDKKKLEKINYDPMEIAKIEFEEEVLPITVKQPMPEKKAVKIKKAQEKIKDEQVVKKEEQEEKEIEEQGEIMVLANPEDESEGVEEVVKSEREASEELQ